MKDIIDYINEAFQTNSSNKDAMFLHADGTRQNNSFSFNVGEKALLIKYDTDGYVVQLRGIVEIGKVLKNSIKIVDENERSNEFYSKLKFDKTGIAIVKENSKYRGKSIKYWVLYNKELIDSAKDGKDLTELLDKGRNSWGFKFRYDEKECIKNLKQYIKKIKE